MNTSDILLIAQQRLEVPGVWIKGTYAMDANYNPVEPESPHACRFCALGAVIKTTDGWQDSTDVAISALVAVLPQETETIPAFNDSVHTKRRMVIGLFSRARQVALDYESNQLCPDL